MKSLIRTVLAEKVTLKCSSCDKLLAEDINPPFRLKCSNCKSVNSVAAGEPMCLTISTNNV